MRAEILKWHSRLTSLQELVGCYSARLLLLLLGCYYARMLLCYYYSHPLPNTHRILHSNTTISDQRGPLRNEFVASEPCYFSEPPTVFGAAATLGRQQVDVDLEASRF